ncbi:transporter, betaine/carnitine/choline family [Corynebacterium sp. CMW7794]|uniref:BCCT family transporter n=1 Tax=Corynebacterium phoceense TaxID=1686286 RepID=A0A540R8N2_9CORY|nr:MULTISPECIES: BCCT family transporter [Corynebacterium]KXB56438.1 transporter, betaine/carnitine/choline family [Corynebacterium sp. DNF00584]KXI18248.1 transporter, betaine/carnitine/choline family [Corynebacterium sp. CMW7794]MBF9010237.1 BCCT family transporter [Corynebacterium phoceense]TQE44096.1 BCCT family transporter [Corynebacterium phoceense]
MNRDSSKKNSDGVSGVSNSSGDQADDRASNFERNAHASPRADAHGLKPATTVEPTVADRSRTRTAKRILKDIIYPHNIHPALVPGVSIDSQKVRYGVDKPILFVVGGLIIAFVVWGVAKPQQVFDISSTALTWVMHNFGWVFTTLAAGLLFFLLYLAVSKYGRIPLGVDGEDVEYSTVSWAAMLFGAGIGIGIIFFGPFEPLTYYLSPRPGAYEAASEEAIMGSLAQAAMHWGINAWAIYAVVGLAVAYVSYRRGRVPLMSSILMPLFGAKSTDSWQGRIIDGLAIIATLFGTAASLGIGAMQISQGVTVVSGWSPTGNALAIGIIVVLSIGTIISAVSGVAKGVRWLSNINLALALVLALFFFIVGPTAFLANVLPATIIEYISKSPEMLSANMGQGEDMQEFLSSWTTFYWAWWVSWSPFVGVFVAKISRGRTIRQYVFGVLFIPSFIIVAAFTILGGTTMWIQRTQGTIAPDGTADSMPAAAEIFFIVLDHLPGAQFIAPVVVVMLAVFFITTADSASLVNSQLSQRGNPHPKKWVTIFWVACMAGIAVVILVAGGQQALQGLQNFITVTALPFAFIIVLMVVALIRELRFDPAVIRQSYEEHALANAVVQGVREHGDDFALAVEPTEPDSEYAAGADFDSTSEEATEWYVRTDEEGTPIPYDYEEGEYISEEEARERGHADIQDVVEAMGEDTAATDSVAEEDSGNQK